MPKISRAKIWEGIQNEYFCHRLPVLAAILFSCTIHAADRPPVVSPSKPNVLFIVSEDNSEQIGCYGEKRVHTPHLDSLAAAGVRFDRAYVPYSVCSPSRAAFLTGLYTRQTGHIGLATHRFSFYKNFKTLPAYLKEAGYYTGFIGKTHVNPENIVEDHIDFRGVKHANFSNTFSIEDYAREARAIFENAAKADKPFLCIINYSDAHRRFIEKTKAGYPTVKVTGDIKPLPWTGVDTPYLREETRNYLNCMNRLDEGIGLVLDDLVELKQRDNTLVVYLADHGGDFMRGKTTCYEGGVKVPMIVSYPKSFPKGHAEDAMVSTMDILPTVLKETGIRIPAELVGTPLQDLQDPKTPRRKYMHTFNTGSAAPLLYLTFGIRDEDYKLIYNPVRDKNLAGISRYKNSKIPLELYEESYVNPPEFELYDLKKDPNEFQNLAADPKHSKTKDHLFKAMRDFQKEIDDPFLDPANVDFFIREQKDSKRQPKKRSQETWSHLRKFWPRPAKPQAKAGPGSPNVLFIAIDDLRPELGCYGDKHIISPNIDALAKSGVRFDRAYCQQAICGPSRASILTGLRPDSTQIHGNHTHFRTHYPDIITLPQHFKNHGYHTRAMGKIYHGVFPKGSSRTVADTFGDVPSWSIPAFRPGPRYYYTEEGISAAKDIYKKIYKPKKQPDPDDWTKKLVFGPATEAPDVADSVLYDGQVADRAVQSLAELSRNPAEPFFLAVGFIKPHSPYIAPKKYWDLYDPAKIKITGQTEFPEDAPRIALHGSGELRRYTDQSKSGPITDAMQRRVKHAYYACISYIDAQIGKVLAALENQGLSDNTIVVLWGDHGYHLGEQNLWGKTTNFELDTRVPLIVRVPGRAGNGSSSQALVELVDLYPTLADLCDLPVSPILEGSSLSPLLDVPSRQWKSAAFSQYTRGQTRGYSVRTDTHRYTEWLTASKVTDRELYEYDEASYPIEPSNLAAKEEKLLASLSQKLAAGHGWKSVRKELPQPGLASSPLRVAKVFSDHMVLPRDREVPVWGTAKPNTKISVTFKKQKHQTKADPDGQWRITLSPTPASTKPADLKINSQTIRDILVGDVWICSGQSNMRWMLNQSNDAQQHIAAANDKHLRLLDLTGYIYPKSRAYDRELLRNTNAENYYTWTGWHPTNKDSAPNFSAIAYHFGQRLRELNPEIPIGLIHNAIGGTPMESWIPEATLLADPEFQELVTIPWYLEDHPRFPKWCGQRGRQNLVKYFDLPDGPAPNHPFKPGFLYAAGITPFTGLPVSGVIWYQGESNATEDTAHRRPRNSAWNRKLFTTLIASWRDAWRAPKLPFIFAQLPGLNRNWPLFREMQAKVAAGDPHTHMAVTIDVGHPTNVHPADKQPVGHRLAEIALGNAASPTADILSPIKIAFDRPIQTRDGKPATGFQLAGKDRKFHPATASIHGAEWLELKSDKVAEPIAVRYGWANDPKLNLVGIADKHPVSPFRSDTWLTAAAKPTPKAPITAPGFTGFESPKPGGFTKLTFDGATWTAPKGEAEILAKLAKSGRQCLHLKGGKKSEVVFELPPTPTNSDYDELTFAAERWTRRAPFSFRVEAADANGKWVEIYNGDQNVKVGRGYLNQVAISLPQGARKFRMTSGAPPNTGVLIDDLTFIESKPMTIRSIRVRQDTAPVLIGQTNSPLMHLVIETRGNLKPLKASHFHFEFLEGARAIERTHFEGTTSGPGALKSIAKSVTLKAGENVITLGCDLLPTASLDGYISVKCRAIVFSHRESAKFEGPTHIRRKIGYALRQRGQDGVTGYRIPGITTTKAGTLVAVYDNRNRSRGDLPGDIDVGMSRSTDGGQSWEPMKIIMDMGDDPKWNYDGIGDPSILTDRVNGTIWVASTWSHGNRSWRGSGPGMKPEETGQFMLVKSNDDGLTWSPPINITKQVKTNANWRFVLQGPGAGITLRDGTLVFPAQFRGVNDEPVSGKPFSTIVYSKDRGETWKIGTGVKIDTTEAQVVQLADESIMINCRDNRGGSRSIYTTKDLGQTWQEHPTTRKALIEPVCNAGLLRIEHPKHGPLLIFSNPNTTRGRHHFTIKVSKDEGMTWPAQWHTLYDERPGSGYSILTPIGTDKIGVLYEGSGDLYFLRFSIDDVFRN
jgi:arylsulfatase A-like enzyme